MNNFQRKFQESLNHPPGTRVDILEGQQLIGFAHRTPFHTWNGYVYIHDFEHYRNEVWREAYMITHNITYVSNDCVGWDHLALRDDNTYTTINQVTQEVKLAHMDLH